MNYEELRLDKQVCHRLYIASNGLTRLYRPLLKTLDLTYAQYVLMMALWEKDGITMGELSNKTLVDKGFLTSSTEALKSKKIIQIKNDSDDKRKKLIYLTAKGKNLQNQAKNIPYKIVDMLSDEDTTEEEVYNLIKALDKINSKILSSLNQLKD
jgi:DNA-binding MarR family transcriptional regulator